MCAKNIIYNKTKTAKKKTTTIIKKKKKKLNKKKKKVKHQKEIKSQQSKSGMNSPSTTETIIFLVAFKKHLS